MHFFVDLKKDFDKEVSLVIEKRCVHFNDNSIALTYERFIAQRLFISNADKSSND